METPDVDALPQLVPAIMFNQAIHDLLPRRPVLAAGCSATVFFRRTVLVLVEVGAFVCLPCARLAFSGDFRGWEVLTGFAFIPRLIATCGNS